VLVRRNHEQRVVVGVLLGFARLYAIRPAL
jgi:hypothetical protein